MAETPQKKIISFDVGIKNMAFCIFSVGTEPTNYTIVDWDVLNLSEREHSQGPTEIPLCQNITTTATKKKITEKKCTKTAKYKTTSDTEPCFLCEKHAKESTKYILPNMKFSSTKLKSMNLEELNKLLEKYSLNICTTKKSAVENLEPYISKNTLTTLVKKKSATSIDLVTIGKHMMEQLDVNRHIAPDITHVIIENQISPIANRMKTIQGMLAQYFIMRVPGCQIEFVSSANKLKSFLTKEKTSENAGEYKQHKRDSVHYTSQVLQQNPRIHCWQSVFDASKKKDDLADAFLQGLWFIQKK